MIHKRTIDIIKICKERNFDSCVEYVIDYMSKSCKCPKEYYNESIIQNIMFEAMCDYIDNCDKPSSFLRVLKETYDLKFIKSNQTFSEAIGIAFQLVQIKNENEYINGFNSSYGE